MDNLRIGVIGIGNMGSGHARRMVAGKVPGAVLTAVCDINPKRRAWAEKNLGEDVQLFENSDDFFAAEVVDAVVIAVPHYDHPPLAIKAFDKNLHVLCEKPAGVYTKQVQEMNEKAAASDRIFALMFNQRQRPLHQKARELIASGELGEIMRTNWIISTWFRSQAYYDSGGWRASWRGEGGGVLLNQCPHNLDLWQWICGMPSRVRAFCEFGKYHDIEVEDDVTAFVQYKNGATGLFVTTTGEAPGTNRLEIVGERGKLLMENGKLTFWRTRENVRTYTETTKKSFASPECWKCEIPVSGKGEEHLGVLKNWANAIRNGEELLSPGEEGLHSLELSNAMLLSAWQDDWVDLPIDDELFFKELDKRIQTSRYDKAKAEDQQEEEATDLSGSFG
ncbi:MAG: Gfo/Idh/MocA family oxidoreductase [Lentisphaeria bacterium]